MNNLTFKAILSLAILLPIVAHARLVDPTRPAGYTTQRILSPEQLRVSSIIIGKHQSSAVINGKRVSPGDTAFDMTVQSISPDEVVLYSKRRGKYVVGLINDSLKAIKRTNHTVLSS